MSEQPSGTVTFLFTDIEGSTRLWQSDPDAMGEALDRHEQIIVEAISAHSGYHFKTVGDALYAAFPESRDAVQSALQAQLAIVAEEWPDGAPIRVRMALHTGRAEARRGDYIGRPLNQCARVVEVAHGGQILLSEATREAVGEVPAPGTALVDLGAHRLRDLARPEHLYQLTSEGLQLEFPPLNSLDSLPHNLPIRRSRFVGRQQDIALVQGLLDQSALLTLTGAGGAGKTRLALMAAAALVGEFADGVWFVDFGPLADPELVPQRTAAALGLRDEPGRTLIETLEEHVRRRHMLLLLDNCEHLIDACANLAQQLLDAGPDLKILATSREPLNVPAEVTWRVPGLALPDVAALPPTGEGLAEEVLRFSAVRLFQERALAAAPGFRVTDENAIAVVEVCRRLDGMPLAIELASARVKVLSAQQILDRLDDQLQLLTGGPRAAVPRQQTLRALIDWSYETLSGRERAVLRRLSVFRGGWTVEAAERICSGGEVVQSEVLDQLTSLIAKSLVKVTERGGMARHALQETVQQYAWLKLVEEDDAAPAHDRALSWFLELAERTEPELAVARQAEWQAGLELELDNLRTALSWSMHGDGREPDDGFFDGVVSGAPGTTDGDEWRGNESQAEMALRLVGALQRFWERRGYLSEGREWLNRALAMPGASARTGHRAKALAGAGMLAWQQGDYFEAEAQSKEGYAIARELGDKRRMAETLSNLATVAQHQGEFSAARSYHEDSLAAWKDLGDKWGIAGALSDLGSQAFEQGEYRWAEGFYEESLSLRRELGDRRGVAMSLNALASVAYSQGEYDAARMLYEEALTTVRELQDRRNVAHVLNNLGRLALEHGQLDDARALLEESLELKAEVGDRRGIANSLLYLGELAHTVGDESDARDLYRESMQIRRALGDISGIAESLEAFAALACAEKQPERATVLFGAAHSLRDSLGVPPTPSARADAEDYAGNLRSALGDAEYERLWSVGAEMAWRQAVEFALGEQ